MKVSCLTRYVARVLIVAIISILFCCDGRVPTGGRDVTSIERNNSFPPDRGPNLVFPGAQGFGAYSVAGRGGQVLKVTNLNDFGSGSLREAVHTSGRRIVVFEVAGEINLKSQLLINKPYLTIAGQTAPSPGITLSGNGLKIETNDILIQHIFVRHTASDGTDAIDVRTGSRPLFNIVIDHVSASWGDDENLSFNPGSGNTRANNVTFSNNLIAEGNGNQYGTLIAAGTKNFSAIGNLWMSHAARQPRINGLVTASLINNVSYNVGSRKNVVIGSSAGPNKLSFVGNVFLPGPDTPDDSYGIGSVKDVVSGTSICLSDNDSSPGELYDDQLFKYLVNFPCVTDKEVKVLPSQRVKEYVLMNAGARPGERDGIIDNFFGNPVDERLIGEVRGGRGKVRTDHPYMAVPKPARRPFHGPAYPGGDYDGDGYTNIEELLHQMAVDVEGGRKM